MAKTTYVWDELSDNVIEEYEDGVLSVSYEHEPGLYGNLLSQNRNSVTRYYHYDGRGDTVALTDDAGNVTDTKEYDAWGIVIASTGSTVTPYQFSGRNGYQFEVVTACFYVRARMYQPAIGRWNSLDPLYQAGSQYIFAYQSPVTGIDPFGNFLQSDEGGFTSLGSKDAVAQSTSATGELPLGADKWICKPERAPGHSLDGILKRDVWLDTCCRASVSIRIGGQRCFEPGNNPAGIPWFNEPKPDDLLSKHFFTVVTFQVTINSVEPASLCVAPYTRRQFKVCEEFPGRFLSHLSHPFDDEFHWSDSNELNTLISESGNRACNLVKATQPGIP